MLSQIAAGITPNAAASSTSLFGREYIALHDGNFGVDMPRQYDGTNFDRVSQIGPGAGVAAVADIIVNISAISRDVGCGDGDDGDADRDAVRPIRSRSRASRTRASTEHFPSRRSSIRCTSLTRRRRPTRPRAEARPRRSARSRAGVHQCAVIFVTRQGYLTRPSAPVSWTSAGDCRANVTGIPSVATLPNIVARILAFTGAGGDNFYYTTGLDGAPQMQVSDNGASSFVVDFSDTALLAGISADSLFQLVELGECAGVIGYSDRLFWWGERNKQNNWDNLTFDGGFGSSANTVPLGWTPDATYFAGGGCDTTGKAIWGGAYAILGDGATATRGLITQSAVTDYNGAPRLLAEHRRTRRACACA